MNNVTFILCLLYLDSKSQKTQMGSVSLASSAASRWRIAILAGLASSTWRPARPIEAEITRELRRWRPSPLSLLSRTCSSDQICYQM